jgi:cytochrome c oxidase subunit 4
MAQPQQHEDEYTHVVPASLYVGIWAALMVLTLTTVLASFAELGPFNIVVALVIATIKGTLVVLFFMHLRYSPKLTIAAVIASIFFLFIMFSLTMTDYLSRAWATYAAR